MFIIRVRPFAAFRWRLMLVWPMLVYAPFCCLQMQAGLREKLGALTQANASLRTALQTAECALAAQREEGTRLEEQLACLRRKLNNSIGGHQTALIVRGKLRSVEENLSTSLAVVAVKVCFTKSVEILPVSRMNAS